ncbi:hypothetical protein PRIC1_004695 [Phytophthora ramorum]
MEVPDAIVDPSEADREEYAGKKASLALQRALAGAGAWMATSVRDQRKCDHPLLPAEMPASIQAKVAKILQERGVREKEPVEAADPKAPWRQQLEHHVARLMQQMRAQPQQFRQLLLMASAETNADCVVNPGLSRGFVDSRSAYRRLRRAAMALGEEIFYMVRAFVRRSETNGVLPQDAQATRLLSLYKLELRRHVTISAVVECIHQADSGVCAPSANNQGDSKPGFCIKKGPNKRPLLRRQVKSAGVTSGGPGELVAALSTRAASAPFDAVGRGSQNQQVTETGSPPDKIKTVHAFKLQALERLLANTWQGSKSVSTRSLQAVPVSPPKLSDETLSQIQERVTTFLYHRSRENYPLWSDPPLSREETARHLSSLVATLLTTPLLQGLSIDQLLEVARAARWQILAPGDTLCTRNTEIDALVVVMDGSLVSSTPTDPTSGASSPLPATSVAISAPVCLGELGVVRSSERWPHTLTAQSEGGVKALTLPKLAFEALLHRFFNGGKAIPPALTGPANALQPRRPSSSPAVIARRLARSFRSSVSGRRPSTAAPTVAMEANIARWHEVRDEKLRDYRAGLEAEQRAAALDALQRAMAELSSASAEEDDTEFSQHSTSVLSPRKGTWSRHEYYPNFNPGSSLMTNPEVDESQEEVVESHELHESSDGLQPNRYPLTATEATVRKDSSTEFADQLRGFYRTLNARRSVMRARLASSTTSDQMTQQFYERRRSSAGATTTATENTVPVSETAWWDEQEEAGNRIEDAVGMLRDDTFGSASSICSPLLSRLLSPPFSSQLGNSSAAPSPSKEELPSPLKSPLKSDAALPSRGSQQGNNAGGTSSEDSDVVWLTSKVESGAPETNAYDGETSPVSRSKNQTEDDRAAASTRARKSALNIMLTRQSTTTMARHSKLLDAETAQHVLIQKHFADTSRLGGTSSGGSRPQSGRPQSAGLGVSELHQSHSHAPLPLRADLQRRMDSVLNELQLPPKTKLDLVLKYTHADHYDQFPMAVQLWERVNGAVASRERVMKSLWEFELLASDPRRHFRSISTHRLREEKERDALFSQLNHASKTCSDALDDLLRCCGDIVCLGDRPYCEKMKKDYVELLYEVEQERLRIIYNGVRPHVAPAIDEFDDETQPAREETENLPGCPSSGRTLINIRVPSAGAISSSLAPRRPLNTKDSNFSPRSSAANNPLEGKVELNPSLRDNQEQETETDTHTPEFAVDGTNAGPTSARYQLATPRESIYAPVSSLNSKQEPENQIRRASRVTVQVQKQRQTELAALSKQLEAEEKESAPFRTVTPTGVAPATQATRPPEKTYTVPTKDAKKSESRMKQQEERASLRELFQQFISRSKS